MTNDKAIAAHRFAIRLSSLIRHSSFVIRHATGPQHRR